MRHDRLSNVRHVAHAMTAAALAIATASLLFVLLVVLLND